VDLILSGNGERERVMGFDITQIEPFASFVPVFFPCGPVVLKVGEKSNLDWANNLKQLLARNDELQKQVDKKQNQINIWEGEFNDKVRTSVATLQRAFEAKGGKVAGGSKKDGD